MSLSLEKIENAVRQGLRWILANQYPADDHPGFAGAFQYSGWLEKDGHRFELLRNISTAFAIRLLTALLVKKEKWAVDFWK